MLLKFLVTAPPTAFPNKITVNSPIGTVKGASVEVGHTPTVTVKKRITRPVRSSQPAQSYPITFPDCYWQLGWSHGYHGTTFEAGADYDCDYRTPAKALWAGTVYYAQDTCWNIDCTSTTGGLVIIIAFVPDLGMEATYYLHLDEIVVWKGEYIHRGQLIGYTGGQVGYGHWPTSSWFTGGPHIEIGFCYPYILWGVNLCPIGHNIDPSWYIRKAIT